MSANNNFNDYDQLVPQDYSQAGQAGVYAAPPPPPPPSQPNHISYKAAALASNNNSDSGHGIPHVSEGGTSQSTPRSPAAMSNNSFGGGSSDAGYSSYSSDTGSNHSAGVMTALPMHTFESLKANTNDQSPDFAAVYPNIGFIAPRENRAAHGHVSWKCFFCGSTAYGHRCQCGKSRDSGALRLFVGQLCREGAAEMANAIISTMTSRMGQPVQLLHIEEHTDRRTNRGKGCCWAYVNSRDELDLVIKAIHKKTYVSISEQTGEVGFRLFPSNKGINLDELCAAEIATLTNNAKVLIHHSPVTCELPAALKSAIRYHTEQAQNYQRQLQVQRAAEYQAATQYYAQTHIYNQNATAQQQQQQQQYYPPQQQQYYAPPFQQQQQQQDDFNTPKSKNNSETGSSSSSCGESRKSSYRWNPYAKAGSSAKVVMQQQP